MAWGRARPPVGAMIATKACWFMLFWFAKSPPRLKVTFGREDRIESAALPVSRVADVEEQAGPVAAVSSRFKWNCLERSALCDSLIA
jgi:hypothetical protein